MSQKSPEETRAIMDGMDQAAKEAESDLNTLDKTAVIAVAAWWRRWYLKAGHKRLGHALVNKKY